MTRYVRTAAFEDFDGHRSPVLRWEPAGRARAHAVFFPPFGDEMNQSRRMFRLTAEALAGRGVSSTVFDLHGTGDSSADFSDATVSAWIADGQRILEAVQSTCKPVVLIGCRLGVALAAKASASLERPSVLLVGWAPLLQGSQQLNGMLRAAKIARMTRPETPDPKTLWAAGEVAWLAGYPISPVLAGQLGALDATAAPRVERAALFELRSADVDAEVPTSDALRHRAAEWARQSVPTEAMALRGTAFWNVADLVDVPQLIEVTADVVENAIGGIGARVTPRDAKQHG